MRFYNDQHRHYCGVDLHTKRMYLCILDQEGNKLLHRNVRAKPHDFLSAVEEFRDDLVVGAECMFTWYWLADLCRNEKIRFILGHALYMKAIHGGKKKDDKLDSEKIARLMRGGTFPLSYVYPSEMRATRDLVRRRMFLVRRRSELLAPRRLPARVGQVHTRVAALGLRLSLQFSRTVLLRGFAAGESEGRGQVACFQFHLAFLATLLPQPGWAKASLEAPTLVAFLGINCQSGLFISSLWNRLNSPVASEVNRVLSICWALHFGHCRRTYCHFSRLMEICNSRMSKTFDFWQFTSCSFLTAQA